MNDLSLKLLRDAGLSPDWMTVYIGWLGFERLYDQISLPSTSVQDYAYERIGLGEDAENYAALRLIDIDLRTSVLQNELRYLKDLAGQSSVTPDLARRKWRLAGLKPLCDKARALPSPSADNEDFWLYDLWDDFHCFPLIWDVIVNHPPLPTVMTDTAENDLQNAVALFDAWSEAEREAILTEAAEAQRNLGGGRVR